MTSEDKHIDTMFEYNEEVILTDNKFYGYSGNIASRNKKVSVTGNLFSKEKMSSIRVGNFVSLSKYLDSIGVEPNEIAELKKSISKDVNVQKELGEHVKNWLLKTVNRMLKVGLTVGREVIVSLLAQAVMKYQGWGK